MSEPREVYLYAVVDERVPFSGGALDVFRWTLSADVATDVAQNILGMVLQVPAQVIADYRRED